MTRLPVLLISIALALAAPTAAHAGWYPGEALDGPSADIVAVDDLDVARDGTGALVWRRLVDGVPHVFLSRLAEGVWRTPERVDGPIGEAAEEAAVAVADGGRVAVAWVSGARVFGVHAPAGSGLQPLNAPQFLHAAGDGAPSGGLDADMGINGTAFAVWRASGGGGADVRAARLKGDAWSLVPAPLDIAATNAAGGDAARPRVAVDAAGTALVAWGEASRVFARRILGLEPSQYPQEASVAELGTADMPEVDVEEDGSFAWVAFRQLDAAGPRALARQLLALQFEAPSVLDTGPGAGPPIVSINGRGLGAAITPGAGGAVLGADVRGGSAFGAVGRLNTQDGVGVPDVALFASDSRRIATAWRAESDDGTGAVLGRFRRDGQPWEAEALLSPPDFGPVAGGSLHIGGNRNGDIAVAMLQGGPDNRRVVVAVYDHPPGRAFPSGAGAWVREAQPTLRWRGGGDLWGVQGYQVLLDGAVAGETSGGTRELQAPAPLADGDHSVQVITVDRRGQVVPSGVRRIRVDTVVPTATVSVTGQLRASRPATVTVEAADVGSGVGAVSVDYGDRSRRGTAARTEHVWARRGTYVVTATVTDKAGNVITATTAVRVRPPPRPRRNRDED